MQHSIPPRPPRQRPPHCPLPRAQPPCAPARSSAEASPNKARGAGRPGRGRRPCWRGRRTKARGPSPRPRPKPGRQGALYRRRPAARTMRRGPLLPGRHRPRTRPARGPAAAPAPGGAQASPAGLLGRRPQPWALPSRAALPPWPDRAPEDGAALPPPAPRPPPPAPTARRTRHCARRLHRQRHPASGPTGRIAQALQLEGGPQRTEGGLAAGPWLEAAHLAAGGD